MRTWPIAVGIFLIMLPVTAVVPLLYELTEGRFPGRSELDRHLFMSANMAGSLLVALFAGLLSDRVGRRKPLIVPALYVYGGCLLLMYGPWAYPVQLGLRFIEGAAHMTALVLAMTMIADQTAGEHKGRAMGMAGAALSLGVAAGTVLGGRISPGSATSLFLIGGLLMLIVALAATRVLKDAELHRPAERLSDMARLALKRRDLLIPYAFTFVDRLTVGFIISTVSLYFATVLDLPPAGIGLAMAAFLLPYAVLTYPAGWLCDRVSPVALMAAGSLGYGSFLIALGFTRPDFLLPVMAAGGIIAALMLAPSLVLTVRLAGTAQATGMGGFHLTGSLGFMLGPLLSVAILTGLRSLGLDPYPAVFVVFGLFEIGCVLLALPWLIRLHRHTPHIA
ncbi:MAG: MFS transporter [Wenzhouxiangella sp.]